MPPRTNSIADPRAKPEVAARRLEVKRLYDLGHTHEEMANILGCSVKTIGMDVYFIRIKELGANAGPYDVKPSLVELATYSTPQQEARRVAVAECLLRRMTYGEIADQLGVSMNTIVNDVKILRRVWASRIMESKDDQVVSELMYIDSLERFTIEGLLSLPPEDQPATLRGLITLMDRRQRLLGIGISTTEEAKDMASSELPVQLIVSIINNNMVPTEAPDEDAIEGESVIIE